MHNYSSICTRFFHDKVPLKLNQLRVKMMRKEHQRANTSNYTNCIGTKFLSFFFFFDGNMAKRGHTRFLTFRVNVLNFLEEFSVACKPNGI